MMTTARLLNSLSVCVRPLREERDGARASDGRGEKPRQNEVAKEGTHERTMIGNDDGVDPYESTSWMSAGRARSG